MLQAKCNLYNSRLEFDMRSVFVLCIVIFYQSTSFAVELPLGFPKNLIPPGQIVSYWTPVDLNGDGLFDYMIAIEPQEKGMGEQNISGKQYSALIIVRQPDKSFKVLEQNEVTFSCSASIHDCKIETFSKPPQITSWVPDQNMGYWLPAYIPTDIASFAEKGYHIISWLSADLNGDGLNDYLVVEEKSKNAATAKTDSSGGDEGFIRSVLIYIRQPDQSLKLVKRNDIVASCSFCFDFHTTEAFVQIAATRRSFSVRRESLGTAFFNIFTYTYGYSRRDNTWQLIRAEEKYDAQTTREASSVDIFTPPKDFGKIDFADFDPESYRGHGLGYVWQKSRKRQIDGTPDWFEVGEADVANDDEHNAVYYADRSTIKVKENMATMLTLIDFKGGAVTGAYKHASETSHVEYDCKGKRYRLLDYYLYSEGMGKGKMVDGNAIKDKWTPMPQLESMNGLLLKLACGM
jgi:hypothetical protein